MKKSRQQKKEERKNGIRSVCVYCGSGSGTDPRFTSEARKFGRILAEHGIRLIYGGGSLGLMGELSSAVIAYGGEVLGIIPEFLVRREQPPMSAGRRKVQVVRNMHRRKMCMFENADAFVALPGGAGTLEEVVEQLTWAQIGHHRKPILFANIGRFWNPLFELFDHMQAYQFIREGLTIAPLVADRVEDILPILWGEMKSLPSNGDATLSIVRDL